MHPWLVSILNPPATPVVPEKYDGFELRYRRLVLRPAEFQLEGFILASLIAYLTLYYIGKRTNSSRAFSWINTHAALYRSQFSTPFLSNEILADGASDLYAYSTGRRGLFSLHTTFTLLPRHDIFQLIYGFLRGLIELDYSPKDEVKLDFKLRYEDPREGGRPGFVWAAVNKNVLNALRSSRWDLAAYTKTTDTITVNPAVQVMTELADVNEVLLKSGAAPSLLSTLRDANAVEYLSSIIITDQPELRPDTYDLKSPLPSLLTRTRHVYLTLNLPPASKSSSTTPLVQAAFELVDLVSQLYGSISLPGLHPARSATLQPESIRKLRAARKEWDDKLEKERTAESLAEEEEAKRAAKKKAEDERISKLGAAEQQKILEKERKRALRKAQTRGAKR